MLTWDALQAHRAHAGGRGVIAVPAGRGNTGAAETTTGDMLGSADTVPL